MSLGGTGSTWNWKQPQQTLPQQTLPQQTLPQEIVCVKAIRQQNLSLISQNGDEMVSQPCMWRESKGAMHSTPVSVYINEGFAVQLCNSFKFAALVKDLNRGKYQHGN